jgi:hypothetical protein
MKCPHCKLENPPTTIRCDCGYDFPAGKVRASYVQTKTAPLRHRGFWIAGWFFALFIFNVIISWNQGLGYMPIVFSNALSRLTSPAELAVSVLIICGILMIKVEKKTA